MPSTIKPQPIKKKAYPIKPVSAKMAKQLAIYRKNKKQFLKENPVCQYPGCSSKETDLHHGKGRTGSLLTDVRYFRSLCRTHHSHIEEHPLEAKQLGLSFNRISNN